MLFRKRNRRPGTVVQKSTGQLFDKPELESFPIEFDSMLKGAVIQRGKKTVRQFAVMVGTTMQLVTSGDTVDRPTYEALLAAGAIEPHTENNQADTNKKEEKNEPTA